jgi:hypothetical protein
MIFEVEGSLSEFSIGFRKKIRWNSNVSCELPSVRNVVYSAVCTRGSNTLLLWNVKSFLEHHQNGVYIRYVTLETQFLLSCSFI